GGVGNIFPAEFALLFGLHGGCGLGRVELDRRVARGRLSRPLDHEMIVQARLTVALRVELGKPVAVFHTGALGLEEVEDFDRPGDAAVWSTEMCAEIANGTKVNQPP